MDGHAAQRTYRKPVFRLPDGACNAHSHVYGPTNRFPYNEQRAYTPPEAPKDALAAMQSTMGISRCVLVHPSAHPRDNAVTLDAIASSGGTYRGVALVEPDVDERELQRLHEGGMRAVRFTFMKKLGGGPPLDAVRRVADKVRSFGWHMLMLIDSEDLGSFREAIASMPVPVVIDAMGCMRVANGGIGQPAFANMLGLLDLEHVWAKIVGLERTSLQDAPWPDAQPFAAALIEKAPDRVLWGLDWPHPNMEGRPIPDDADLVDAIPQYVPDPALQQRLLVTNPARLYGF